MRHVSVRLDDDIYEDARGRNESPESPKEEVEPTGGEKNPQRL